MEKSMRVEGFIKKVIDNDITYFVAEVPSLLVVTDGDTEEEAYYMVQDAIGLMLEVHTEGKINKNNIRACPHLSLIQINVHAKKSMALKLRASFS